jgi:hypothetical protein
MVNVWSDRYANHFYWSLYNIYMYLAVWALNSALLTCMRLSTLSIFWILIWDNVGGGIKLWSSQKRILLYCRERCGVCKKSGNVKLSRNKLYRTLPAASLSNLSPLGKVRFLSSWASIWLKGAMEGSSLEPSEEIQL